MNNQVNAFVIGGNRIIPKITENTSKKSNSNTGTRTTDTTPILPKPLNMDLLMNLDISSQLQDKGEWERYLLRPVSTDEAKIDPLQWWNIHKDQFPVLYEIAMEHLQIPASSTSSERAFSQMGRLITKQRNRLDPKNASMLHFLKSNGDLW
jgi:hypothetical protein